MNFLIQIAVMVVASFVASALAPKPPRPKPASLNDWDFPVPDEGTPQAVFFGDCWTSSWCVLGVGNYRTLPIKINSGGKK
ncbi:hypothetical protein MO867_14070 [Microbulbifer sp. OS29]|uniref:Uncharacterized protein n=1 Tax=Microbulbifer okhotskensis TaxID=2926617 RepID=A0A9X2J8E7_9GAMM|nr:hypothetical protein [Microbulbifer okhotskensis]MCO1335461.1 hypothetical protein [Microbulbifer okhotskensis]